MAADASKFQDAADFVEDWLPLPYAGKTYRIPGPDAALGLRVTLLMQTGMRVVGQDEQLTEAEISSLRLDDETEETLYLDLCGRRKDVFGNVINEGLWPVMVADGVPYNIMKLMANTAMLWIGMDVDTAALFWRTQGDMAAVEKASAPNREQRRKSARSGALTRTAAASTAKRAASGNTTKSPKMSGKPSKAAAPATR